MQIMHSSIEYDMALSCLFTPGDDAYAVYLLLLYYCSRTRCSIIYRNIVVMFVTLLMLLLSLDLPVYFLLTIQEGL